MKKSFTLDSKAIASMFYTIYSNNVKQSWIAEDYLYSLGFSNAARFHAMCCANVHYTHDMPLEKAIENISFFLENDMENGK